MGMQINSAGSSQSQYYGFSSSMRSKGLLVATAKMKSLLLSVKIKSFFAYTRIVIFL